MNLAALIERSRTERESWKYTDIKPLADLKLAPAANDVTQMLALNGPHLTFVNGVYSATHSDLKTLPEGFLQDDANTLCLTLASKTDLSAKPVILRFIDTPQKTATEAATQLRIVLNNDSRLTLIEEHLATAHAETSVRIVETEIALGEHAHLTHGKIVRGTEQTIHLATTHVRIATSAFYDNFALLNGGKITRNEINAHLEGKQAQCHLHGLQLLRGVTHVDTLTRIVHAAPEGTSRQVYKSVVADRGRAAFQGKVVVDPDAQKTDAYQLSRALLLSDQAEMDAKPELEINADDVKCSHGSAIGNLDDDALFYLRARGIAESEARALLIRAFICALADDIQNDALRTAMNERVEEWLA